MKYEDVINSFLSSVKEDDPYKSSKKLQIERWGRSWWIFRAYLDFFIEVLSGTDCWDKTEDFYGVKLNIKKVGEILINENSTYFNTKLRSRKKNPIIFENLYRIACWCCLEDDINRLFNKDVKSRSLQSNEKIISLAKSKRVGPLMIFWSHYINKDKLSKEDKEKYSYRYGFECAMSEKNVEALEFFWKKIESDNTISVEEKEGLLFKVAFYKSLNGTVTVGMIEFCLRHLNPDKYSELLKENFKNKCRNILLELISEHSLEKAKQLFSVLKPEDVSSEFYTDCLMYGVLRNTISLPYDDLVNSRNELAIHILNRPGFENHRQHFLNNLCTRFSCRDVIAHLIKINRSEAVWNILDLASKDKIQIQSILKSKEFNSLEELCDRFGDKISADKIREYHKIAHNVLEKNELPNSPKNIKCLTQSISMVADKKEHSTTVSSESFPFSSQSQDTGAAGDFITNKKSQDLL